MINYERNSNPKYYEEHCADSNCGSYALNLQGWYDPEGYFCDVFNCECPDDGMMELYACGYSEDEINRMYVDTLVEGILKEFDGEIRLVKWKGDKINDDEELVAFRTFAFLEDDEDDYFCADFHFKVFRDGKWMEKQGWQSVKESAEDEWGRYDSKTYYFAHKIIA